MLKNTFAKTIVAATSFSIALAMPSVTAFATEPTTVTPDETTGQVSVISAGTYKTPENTNITTENVTAVNAQAGADLTVNGNISVTSDEDASNYAQAVIAGGSTVTVNGNITTNAATEEKSIDSIVAGNSTITVRGDVTNTGYGRAILAENNSNLEITGNVQSTQGNAIDAKTGSNVSVGGDVTSEYFSPLGIENSAEITVTGNVTASGGSSPINLYLSPNTPSGKIDIKGKVTGITGIWYSANENVSFTSADQITSVLPEITYYELNCTPGLEIVVGEQTGLYYQEVKNYLSQNINCYIKKGDSVELVSSTSANPDTMKTTDSIVVRIPDGKDLRINNNTMLATRNTNGTYTINLTSIRGGITIDAIDRIIEAASEATGAPAENIQVVVDETPQVVVTPVASDNYGAPAGAIVVNSVAATAPIVVPATSVSASTDEKLIIPARTVTLDTKQVSGAQLQQAIIDNVKATPAGSALRIETSTVSVFDVNMIEAIAANPTIDVEVLFTYNGQKLRVVIPAGYDVRSLLDTNGYCGYLRLAFLLGSQVVG